MRLEIAGEAPRAAGELCLLRPALRATRRLRGTQWFPGPGEGEGGELLGLPWERFLWSEGGLSVQFWNF